MNYWERKNSAMKKMFILMVVASFALIHFNAFAGQQQEGSAMQQEDTVADYTYAMEDAFPAYKAGSWQSDAKGVWYLNPDGTYPYNSWNWIDGNNDGIAEYYHFDKNGYLMTNEAVDMFNHTNSSGALCDSTGVLTINVPVCTDPSVNDLSQYAGRYVFYKSENADIINSDRLGSEEAVDIITDGYKLYVQPIYKDGSVGIKELMMVDDKANSYDSDNFWIKPIPTEREIDSTKTDYGFKNGMFFIEKICVYDYFKR